VVPALFILFAAPPPATSSLTEQASYAISDTPSAVRPANRLALGQALENCSFDSAKTFVLQAFEEALTLPKPGDKDTLLRVISFLSSGKPEHISLAQELAERIDYKTVAVRRQQVYKPILDALIARQNDSAIRQLLIQVEAADHAYPLTLARAAARGTQNADLASEITQAARKAIEAGQRDPAEKPAGPPPKSEEDDPLSRAFEDVQEAAEKGSGAVAVTALSIKDPREREGVLTSALAALKRAGKTSAAEAVSAVLSSLPPREGFDQHPAEMILSSPDNLRRALAVADTILASEDKRYQAAGSDSERLKIYQSADQEPFAAYQIAAGLDFDFTAESALRVLGVHRAEVLTTVLERACRTHSPGRGHP